MASTIGRRDFVRITGAAGAAAAAGAGPWDLLAARGQAPAPGPDAAERDLALAALDAARSAGATYADVRISRDAFESVATRERQITNVSKSESYGIGVRAFAGGSWGFAATRDPGREAVVRAAREAAAIAIANDRVAPSKLELSPVARVPDGRWVTPHEVDPFTIPVERKADLLFKAKEAALAVKGVRFVASSLASVKESRLTATSEGSLIQQTFIRINPSVVVTAVAADNSDSQTRDATIPPAGRGWEYITSLDLTEHASVSAEQAVMKLSAPPVEAGVWDLVLHPSHLWLTIHESIAHPTELDRALGYEANYAGTTFLAPPEQVLGKFKLGGELMTFEANRTEPGGCATTGWDDEGVAASAYPIIDKGLFVSYQSVTRELVARTAGTSTLTIAPGHAYGQDWSSIPFPRMPNVSLRPAARDIGEDEVLAEVKRGLYIEGDGSYSIDQQRYNFQFGGQAFWEVRDGKRGRMLRDVAYVARTPEFWRSMTAIGGRRTYQLGATFGDAKGQPGQSNAVSHGCPVALFRGVTVIRTA
jgi:TldD protein